MEGRRSASGPVCGKLLPFQRQQPLLAGSSSCADVSLGCGGHEREVRGPVAGAAAAPRGPSGWWRGGAIWWCEVGRVDWLAAG